jgi:putative transposase
MKRCRIRALDLSSWPAFDADALPQAVRETFQARRQAVELYASGSPLREIEAITGVDRRQLYRLLDHCSQPHEDGRLFGWRGVVPYAHVTTYRRVARVQVSRDGTGRGAAGAFGLLLEACPALPAWIAECVRGRRISVRQVSTDDGLQVRLHGLKPLHLDFLRQCRAQGLGAADYPFNTEQQGIRSFSAALRRECLLGFGRGARLAGARHLKGLPVESDSAPVAAQFLDVVEFDGHRLDVRLKVVLRDPLGFEQSFEIERIWLLVVIDVWSRAVLGWHVASGASIRVTM